jgi:hypothetical protein
VHTLRHAVFIGAFFSLSLAARADGVLDDYVKLQVGNFTSEAQALQDPRYATAVWRIVEIWQDDDPAERWLYTEAWLGDAKAPYLQRITRLRRESESSIVASRYTIPEAARFVGAPGDPTVFGRLRPQDLVALPGCDVMIVRAGAGRFEGGTVGDHCRNGYKGAAYAVSRLAVAADEMTNWDRGFDATGALVWGPATGGYQFRRSPAPDVK